MSDYGYPEWNTGLASTLLAVVVGACVFAKALDLAGYPVWLPFAPVHAAEDAMQRIDGMIRRSVRGLTGALSSRPGNIPPGLGNISNSCYQNSVIQGLAALPSVRDYLARTTARHASFTTDTTNGALHDLLAKLNDPDNQGRYFWIPGKLKSMSTFTQQDAQEYYSKILDEMDTELKKASSSKRQSSVSSPEATSTRSDLACVADDEEAVDSEDVEQKSTAEQPDAVPNPLDGLIAQRVGCTACGYSEGLSLISFNCITVSLGSNNAYDIRDCLDEYTDLEHIDGVECAKCTLLKQQKILTPLAKAKPGSPFEARLNAVLEVLNDEKLEDSTLVKTLNIPKKNWVQSTKSKQIVVARAPKSLVLHVNRSIFDESTGAQYKNIAEVAYPPVLDLADWCLGSSPSGSRQPDISLEEWPRDPKTSMLSASQERTAPSPFQYRLRAVITHAGTHGYGHYICFRPHARIMTESAENLEGADEPQGEQWWRFSDDNVYQIPEAHAHRPDVFMLFYERLDDSSIPLPQKPFQGMHPIASDAPLPPADVRELAMPSFDCDDEAAVPLPDDDDFVDLQSPGAAEVGRASSPSPKAEEDTPLGNASYPTPPSEHPVMESSQKITSESTSHGAEIELSETESEDAPSTYVDSDIEGMIASPPTPKPFVPMPPHMMRTAGNAASRGQGSRQSLPMVSAT